MAGTSEGGKKAAAERKEKDPDVFKKIGKKGGLHSHGGSEKAEDNKQDNKKEDEGDK